AGRDVLPFAASYARGGILGHCASCCDIDAAVMPAATPKGSRQSAVGSRPTAHWQLPIAALFLLAGDGPGRALAGPGIGVGALAAHRQAAAVTQAAIAAEIHQPLDV